MNAAVYRADIDGLRAVAVLLVVLFHAGFGFSGGFIGVDVFFVISGYLITGIVAGEIRAQKFSPAAFLLRRIRRILPASLLMILVTLLSGLFFLLPEDLLEVCYCALSQVCLAANVYLWKKISYFDSSVELKPLLHLWSMAVEEQFYLLYPLLLIACPLHTRSGRIGFSVVFVLAVAVGAYGHLRHPSAAFYLLPCRVWELMLGGMLHVWPAITPRSHRSAEGLRLSGLLAILISGWVGHDAWAKWLQPGLIPALATCAVIRAGADKASWSLQILSSRVAVLLGKISFSLYLWHWPILASLKHLETDLALPVSGPAYRFVALLLAMACGYLSWRFVEEPIRRRRWLPTATGLLGATGAGSLSIVLLAAVTAWGSGFPTRFDSRVIEYMAATAGPGSFARSLQAADVPASDLHAAGNRDAKCRILLLGDSHAMRLMFGLAPLIEKSGCRIDQITRYSTAPLPGFRHVSWNRAGAADFCDAAYQKIQTERWDCVVLAASWYTYVEEDPLLFEALVSGVEKIVASGAKVCLVTPVPDQLLPLPRTLCAAVRNGGNPELIGVRTETFRASARKLSIVLSRLQQQFPPEILLILDPVPAITDSTGLIRCEMDGKCMYSDHFHLSNDGATRVAGFLFPDFSRFAISDGPGP